MQSTRQRDLLTLAVVVAAALVACRIVRAETGPLQHRLDRIERQLQRDRGTVRFMLNHPASRHHRRFMRAEKRAEHRIVLELAERRHVLALLHPPYNLDRWQRTLDCENGGSWADGPGYFIGGPQFDPGTWAFAARHTGHWDLSPVSQALNADYAGAYALRNGYPDPWPNCPDPYYG